jgi:hypothetical protein
MRSTLEYPMSQAVWARLWALIGLMVVPTSINAQVTIELGAEEVVMAAGRAVDYESIHSAYTSNTQSLWPTKLLGPM